jgi:hypothetical protein
LSDRAEDPAGELAQARGSSIAKALVCLGKIEIGLDPIPLALGRGKRPWKAGKPSPCPPRKFPADADTAKVLTMDEARRIATNIAKLPTLLKGR